MVQNRHESPGSTIAATMAQPAKVAVAVTAARRRPASQSIGMKISGVSLIAAATPINDPNQGVRRSASTSTAINPARNRLTCPYRRSEETGAERKSASASGPDRSGFTSIASPATVATVARVQRICIGSSGSQVSGPNSTPANGG